jgi:Kef-type K+ transport system membrane component KefB
MMGLLVALAVIGAALAVGTVGRRLARVLRQPEIVGDIALCLICGALLAGWTGWGGAHAPGRTIVSDLGHAGLALFLIGVAYELRSGGRWFAGRALAWLSAGSALLPMAFGSLFAVWVLTAAGPTLRGTAPAPALVLFLALALAVTAVPVLAGILRDRGIFHTDTGRLAMASAVLIDCFTWVLLAVAIGLVTGSKDWTTLIVFVAVALMAALVCARVLALVPVREFGAGRPWLTTVAVAVAAIIAAFTTRDFGLTDVFGAVLVGLVLPVRHAQGHGWRIAVERLQGLGRGLLPVLFFFTGATLAAGPHNVVSWTAILLAVSLAVGSKIGGSYLGARLGGQSAYESRRLAALMNTRGLTEIIVLQAGYSTGILTPALYLALLIMAMLTTAMSGPLLQIVEARPTADRLLEAKPS